jgi:hypothetical protein
MQKANDGEFAGVDNPERIRTIVTAGAALQGLFTAGQVYRDLFNFVSNVEVTGGRGPQAETATQEKIISAHAGAGIGHMQGEVDKLMTQAGENLLWYAHHHPELLMTSEYKAAGTKGVNRKLYPSGSPHRPRRDWPFDRSKLTVVPYSYRRKSPDERLQFVQGVLGLLTPLLPMLAQQGVALDGNALIQIFSELGDAPELQDLFTAASAAGQQGPQGAHERTLPGQTQRTYTRQSQPQPEAPGQAVAEMSPQDFGSQQGATA